MAANMWGSAPATGQQVSGNSMISFINDDSIVANYPVAPGYTVALINVNDPNDGKMFIKSIAPNGMPNQTRVFSLQEITPKPQGQDVVSRKEFEALQGQLQQILAVVQKAKEEVK
jgi:hypothetical protein